MGQKNILSGRVGVYSNCFIYEQSYKAVKFNMDFTVLSVTKSVIGQLMKIRILVLFFSLSIGFLHSQGLENAAKHVGAGIVIGGVGGYAAQKIFKGQSGWTWAGAVGSSFAAGLSKEIYDKSTSDLWQMDDVVFTTVGGFVSGLVLDMLFENKGGKFGKNCGCLVVYQHHDQSFKFLPTIKLDGSGDIRSEIQVSYFLE